MPEQPPRASFFCEERIDLTEDGITYVPPDCPYGIQEGHRHVAEGDYAACTPWCPGRGEHHLHPWPEGTITGGDITYAIDCEIERGNFSIRGIAYRLRGLGVSRLRVRRRLWALVPDYMEDDEARHGRHRVTNASDPRRLSWPRPAGLSGATTPPPRRAAP